MVLNKIFEPAILYFKIETNKDSIHTDVEFHNTIWFLYK